MENRTDLEKKLSLWKLTECHWYNAFESVSNVYYKNIDDNMLPISRLGIRLTCNIPGLNNLWSLVWQLHNNA